MIERLPNFRHLAAFAATVEHGSVTRAAQQVSLTQPALTQAIARLESDLGCQLFEREPGGMLPTEPAQLLYPRTKAALEKIGSRRVTATQVRALVALARGGSYREASQLTGLATASLHRAIADLSAALGENLVERRGRHIHLSRRGERRARNFGLALAEIRSGYGEVSRWLGKTGGLIVIGAMPLSRARWLPRSMVAFCKEHPAVDLKIVEGSYTELVGPLREGEIDFLLGALRDDAAIEDLDQQPAFDDMPQIIMRAGHPLCSKSRVSGDDLGKYPWVMPSATTPLHGYWTEMFAAAKVDLPHLEIECGSVLTIRELLLETDLMTLLSPDQLRVEIDAGLLVAHSPPTMVKRTIGITTRRDWRPTATQSDMLRTLMDFARSNS